ncbi:MAG: hypothetical protein A3E83_01320 [Gammaproteobacteria bacterium RIFCSPHIGHO2_12_FULL_41_20]|nr:MAG: hypothetical protein A3E83_01320 [Gammaproteobacteria bacterium RIFCSPHIGHO2_12_FULL_41_20]
MTVLAGTAEVVGRSVAMQIVLDALLELSKNVLSNAISTSTLPEQVETFRQSLNQTVAQFSLHKDGPPIEFADRLLAAFPQEHPVYYERDVLVRLELIADVYEKNNFAGYDQRLLTEFYQALDTVMVHWLLRQQYTACQQNLRVTIQEKLKNDIQKQLNTKGEVEMETQSEREDRVIRLVKGDLTFQLIMQKYYAVNDLLSELTSGKPLYQSLISYRKKFAVYQPVLGKDFITSSTLWGGLWYRASGAVGYVANKVWWRRSTTSESDGNDSVPLPVVMP